MIEGSLLGPYRLLHRLGTGGMGVVYAAERVDRPDEKVAIKCLHEGAYQSQMRKFLDEARLISRLSHPGIVRLIDTQLVDGQVVLVMELLEGVSLDQLTQNGEQLPLGLVLGLAAQALAALEHAHQATDEKGEPLALIHRDLKPSNLFLTFGGQLKVIDFGIAQAAGMEQTRTRTGAIRGSLPYTSPEQANEEPLDPRSDLFSVALVLRELLTGRRVFAQSHEAALLRALLFEPISPLGDDRPDLPPQVLAVFGSALARARDERPSGAAALSRALEEAAPGLAWGSAAIGDWLLAKGTRARAPITETSEWSSLAPAPPAAAPRRRGRALAWAGALLAIFAAVSWAAAARRWAPSLAPALEPLAIARPDGGEVDAAARAPVEETVATAPTEPVPDPGADAKTPKSAVRRRPLAGGFLTVDSRPVWARVSVDGANVGTTPVVRLPLAAGPHVLTAVSAQGQPRRQKISIASGKEQRLKIDWERP